jgi:hypothetical protein
VLTRCLFQRPCGPPSTASIPSPKSNPEPISLDLYSYILYWPLIPVAVFKGRRLQILMDGDPGTPLAVWTMPSGNNECEHNCRAVYSQPLIIRNKQTCTLLPMTAPSYGRTANARDYTSSDVRGGETNEGVCRFYTRNHNNLRKTKTRSRGISHYIMPTQLAVKSHK